MIDMDAQANSMIDMDAQGQPRVRVLWPRQGVKRMCACWHAWGRHYARAYVTRPRHGSW